jgi:deazaflavin-dependent oxidoreductase (nitroreductase family)
MKLGDLYNPIVKSILRSPLRGLMSSNTTLLTFTGRKSGRQYSTPISYAREGSVITLITRRSRQWWKNLQGGAPVTVLLKGQERPGLAETIIPGAEAALAEMQKVYPGMPRNYGEKLVSDTVVIKIQLDAGHR